VASSAGPEVSPPAPVLLTDGRRPTFVHLVAEYGRYARTGGLGEAVMGLAQAQQAGGHDVVVFLPLYRTVRDVAPDLAPLGRPLPITLGGRTEEARYFREVHPPPGPRVVFVDLPWAFGRAGLYGEGGAAYGDNALRYAFFCRAALEAIPRLIAAPVLLHAHDWHAALALMYLRTQNELRMRLGDPPAVFSVHNAGYQGHYGPDVLGPCGIPAEAYTHETMEWYGQVNLLKGGLAYADQVVTVSPGHARELRTTLGGFGLHGIFSWLGDRLTGITNGIDTTVWNPSSDPHIAATYAADDLAPKARCKAALQRSFGLPQRRRLPLFAFTGRLVTQKGIDLLLASASLHTLDAQFVFLGTGERRYEEALLALALERPQHVGVQLDFTDALEHKLMAGADLFLMPSQYEPCGLTQLRAQRYGTLPVGRRVGGIADTVRDDATGFLFDAYDAGALDQAVARALARYQDPDGWEVRMRDAMRTDVSWARAAAGYAEVYRRAVAHHASCGSATLLRAAAP